MKLHVNVSEIGIVRELLANIINQLKTFSSVSIATPSLIEELKLLESIEVVAELEKAEETIYGVIESKHTQIKTKLPILKGHLGEPFKGVIHKCNWNNCGINGKECPGFIETPWSKTLVCLGYYADDDVGKAIIYALTILEKKSAKKDYPRMLRPEEETI